MYRVVTDSVDNCPVEKTVDLGDKGREYTSL